MPEIISFPYPVRVVASLPIPLLNDTILAAKAWLRKGAGAGTLRAGIPAPPQA